MAKLERSLRSFLSDWHVWVGIAYFGLAAVVVALYVLFGRTAHEEANRAASARSAASTQVGQCFVAVRNAPVVEGFLKSHEAIIDNGLLTNRALIRESPGDPANPVRRSAIARLMEAAENAHQLSRLISATTPTRKSCLALAAQLHVDPSRYLRQPN